MISDAKRPNPTWLESVLEEGGGLVVERGSAHKSRSCILIQLQHSAEGKEQGRSFAWGRLTHQSSEQREPVIIGKLKKKEKKTFTLRTSILKQRVGGTEPQSKAAIWSSVYLIPSWLWSIMNK